MPDNQEKKSAFLSILHTWPEYFDTLDEGLGTTYERFILQRYFKEIKEQYAVESLIEVPSFGMTGVSGINSLWWSKNGVTPVVVDTDSQRIQMAEKVWQKLNFEVQFQLVEQYRRLPFKDQTFDMGWNFASLWFVADLGDFFMEMNRLVKKTLFICVPNQMGLGYKLRGLLKRQDISGFFPQNCDPDNFLPLLSRLGWRLMKKGYLDIPPWPDIAMKKEDLFRKMGLGFLLKNKEQTANNVQRTCIIDYFNGERPELEKKILKYDFLEKAPFPIKQIWGHHRFFIFEKRGWA
ncbi:MAG TPA: class I SAM-dependent methyltransferase [Calditrichaeota bacterium]|nr:class I SAM-dependent methyltransferase [Calditrichota bacterium]